ncbi:MAG TPA: class I SAM-dependent methyltransferase [Dehalococcoidia bacterium]
MKWSLAASRATSVVPHILSEIPLLLYSPELERAMSDRYYNSNLVDYTEARHQHAGLFPFEESVLARYFPKPPAHLLLPGAGTGRELLVLLDRGYTVDAYEPVPAMADFATGALDGRTVVQRMTLQEWAERPSRRYDGIFTGWGMWTHINRHDDRVTTLRAMRDVCDHGPLFVSFLRREHVNFAFDGAPAGLEPLHPPPSGGAQRIRDLIRRRVLRREPIERGITLNDGIFKHIATEAELRDEGEQTGWRLDHYSHDGTEYGHAVLLPA